MTVNYPYKAKQRVEALAKTLRTMAERDPEQDAATGRRPGVVA